MKRRMRSDERPTPARPQFSLRKLLVLTAACAILFAAFRWLGMPSAASALVAVLLTFSLVAAGLLVLVIVRSVEPDADHDDRRRP